MVTLESAFYFSDMPFSVQKYSYDKYEDIELHQHDFIEIAYVYNGKGIHVMDNKEYEVSQGDLFIINVDTLHSFFPLDKENSGQLKVYNCMFDQTFIKTLDIEIPILKEISQIFLYKSIYREESDFDADIRLGYDQQVEIKNLFQRMFIEYSQKQEGYSSVLKLMLSEFLIYIYRSYKAQLDEGGGAEFISKRELILSAIDFLKENYSSKLRVDDLSSHFYISKSYFSALFKKVTGVNVSDYIQRVRIEQACKLLVETNGRVTDIMQKVGYTDYRFFNKSFKKITGLTARDYKNKYSGYAADDTEELPTD